MKIQVIIFLVVTQCNDAVGNFTVVFITHS